MSLGGHLATVRGDAENRWPIDTFTQNGDANLSLWIGLNHDTSGTTFTWSDGEPVTYTHWASGEPNTPDGQAAYAYIVQPVASASFPLLVPGQWNDIFDSAQDPSTPVNPTQIIPEGSTTTPSDRSSRCELCSRWLFPFTAIEAGSAPPSK